MTPEQICRSIGDAIAVLNNELVVARDAGAVSSTAADLAIFRLQIEETLRAKQQVRA